jgi:segregation and condensation protein A
MAPPPESPVLFESLGVEPGAVCPVKLPAFEGPLDLLLHLIRIDEVEITELPIARIAEQYLEYLTLMRELQIDVAAEYLVMAATLAWIKSRMLLPGPESEDEEEGPDPRAELVARLLEYQRFKQAAEELGQRRRLGRDVFAPTPAQPAAPDPAEAGLEVSMFALLRAVQELLRRVHVPAQHELSVERVTVRERMQAVMEALAQADSLEFASVFTARGETLTRTLVVATFLAILELARIAALRIYQGAGETGAPEGPIRLRRAAESDPQAWAQRISELM